MNNAATAAIAIGLAAVIVCAMIVFATSAPRPVIAVCVDPGMREQARAIMLTGLDEALRRHTIRVYNTWMKDPSEQPRRARAGMKHGIDAYIGAYKAAHDWNPPPC